MPARLRDELIDEIRRRRGAGETRLDVATAMSLDIATVRRYDLIQPEHSTDSRIRVRTPAVIGWAPLCMEPDEWAEWQRMNPRLVAKDHAERPCSDCPVSYAEEMRAKSLCNGTPGGEKNEDLPMTPTPTVRPAATPPEQLRSGPAVAFQTGSTRTTTIELELPCKSCIHLPVCRIRPESPRLMVSSAPAFDPLELRGTVDCEHYRRAGSGGRPPKAAAAR